ncbi:MAG TPA: hypothetical protein VJQ82_25585 [Terriglobales bacterium]|nr:hypothetical protein [Terriglobales bacterium]
MKKAAALLGMILLAAAAMAQNVTVPVGTGLKVKLETTLSTFSSKVGDPFSGRVMDAVMLDGKTVIPAGATVQGRVTKVTEPRRIAGKPTIGLFPETLILPNGNHFMLNAPVIDTNLGHGTDVNNEGEFKGDGHDRRDTIEVGAGTGGGMLIGGLIGGGPGVLIGGAVGAGATTVHWLVRHRSATLPSGTELTLELSRPLELNTPVAQSAGQ